MLVLKIHNGKQAGKEFPIQDGTYTIGRSEKADIRIISSQVSKIHAEISIHNNRIFIKDLKSRNGTFINGLQIREEEVKSKDKITLHDVVITIRHNNTTLANNRLQGQIPVISHGNLAINQSQYQQPSFDQPVPTTQNNNQAVDPQLNFKEKANGYIETIMLPGVYKLTEWMEFKWVVGIFLGILITLITVLSTIPAVSLLKASVQKESQRRALTIAKNMVAINKTAISQGTFSSIDLRSARSEAGVLKAIIVDSNGSIIAPSSSAGKHPNIDFLHSGRQQGKLAVEQINDNEIGAIVPIKTYNPNTGSQSISAYSFVLYDMGSIAIDDERTLSLYIQIFFISLIVGAILFYFLFKLFEFPITQINSQLDKELQNPMGNISLKFNLDIIQKLISNINSSLTRTQNNQDSQTFSIDRSAEINNLVQIIGFPAIAILNNSQSITAFNDVAAEVLGFTNSDIGLRVDAITDQALQLNLQDLIQQCLVNPAQLINNQLEISGTQFDLMGQAVYGSDEIEYFIISFIQHEVG